MTRGAFERSLVDLARSWAGAVSGAPSTSLHGHLSIRCIAAGAGLPDDLPTIFLFCLVQSITTCRPPWPAAAAAAERDFRASSDEEFAASSSPSREPISNLSDIRLRPVLDVPLGACTARGAPRILSEHQLPTLRGHRSRANVPALAPRA
eukprot:tig00000227_g19841.t1